MVPGFRAASTETGRMGNGGERKKAQYITNSNLFGESVAVSPLRLSRPRPFGVDARHLRYEYFPIETRSFFSFRATVGIFYVDRNVAENWRVPEKLFYTMRNSQ